MSDERFVALLRRIDDLRDRASELRRKQALLHAELVTLGDELRKAVECGSPAVCPDGTKLFCNSRRGHEGLHADGNWDGGQLLYNDEGRFV